MITQIDLTAFYLVVTTLLVARIAIGSSHFILGVIKRR